MLRLDLLHLDEEGLVLRRPDVGLEHTAAVRKFASGPTRTAGEAPVDREADLPHVLAVDEHRLEPLRDQAPGR
jgi:hypothetical protein